MPLCIIAWNSLAMQWYHATRLQYHWCDSGQLSKQGKSLASSGQTQAIGIEPPSEFGVVATNTLLVDIGRQSRWVSALCFYCLFAIISNNLVSQLTQASKTLITWGIDTCICNKQHPTLNKSISSCSCQLVAICSFCSFQQ